MKRPECTMPKRPSSAAGAIARNRKQAAIQMVRLEFEASRLELATAQAEARAAIHKRDLANLSARRQRLISALNR
ncbi:MAG: hypothetical protein AAGF88_09135 [Pseudomonadota bacterium]